MICRFEDKKAFLDVRAEQCARRVLYICGLHAYGACG